MLTGISVALMLLAFGFFLAGVPLGTEDTSSAAVDTPAGSPEPSTEAAPTGESADADIANGQDLEVTASPTPNASTRTTGAFGQPLARDATASPNPSPASATQQATDTPSSATATASSTPSGSDGFPSADVATETPAPTGTTAPTATATPTRTPSPTSTSTATTTPTPIRGQTALINTQGSTLWVRRTPGGQPIALLQDQDIVIPSTGHAHQGGVLWREVSTVEGELGWVQEEYLEVQE